MYQVNLGPPKKAVTFSPPSPSPWVGIFLLELPIAGLFKGKYDPNSNAKDERWLCVWKSNCSTSKHISFKRNETLGRYWYIWPNIPISNRRLPGLTQLLIVLLQQQHQLGEIDEERQESISPIHRQHFPKDRQTTSNPWDGHQNAGHILTRGFYWGSRFHLWVPNWLQRQSEWPLSPIQPHKARPVKINIESARQIKQDRTGQNTITNSQKNQLGWQGLR